MQSKNRPVVTGANIFKKRKFEEITQNPAQNGQNGVETGAEHFDSTNKPDESMIDTEEFKMQPKIGIE